MFIYFIGVEIIRNGIVGNVCNFNCNELQGYVFREDIFYCNGFWEVFFLWFVCLEFIFGIYKMLGEVVGEEVSLFQDDLVDVNLVQYCNGVVMVNVCSNLFVWVVQVNDIKDVLLNMDKVCCRYIVGEVIVLFYVDYCYIICWYVLEVKVAFVIGYEVYWAGGVDDIYYYGRNSFVGFCDYFVGNIRSYVVINFIVVYSFEYFVLYQFDGGIFYQYIVQGGIFDLVFFSIGQNGVVFVIKMVFVLQVSELYLENMIECLFKDGFGCRFFCQYVDLWVEFINVFI